jgi:hypothetical protein
MRGLSDREADALVDCPSSVSDGRLAPVPDEKLPVLNALIVRRCVRLVPVFDGDWSCLMTVKTPLGKLALQLYNAGCK